jgi:hypothetical protein
MLIEKRNIDYRVRYVVIQNAVVLFLSWNRLECEKFVIFNKQKGN